MTLAEEFRSRNFSIYGQWTGVLCIILCIAVGIANLFNLTRPLLIIFSIICLVSGFILVFIEIPLLLRICPTSAKFDAFIRRFTTNYMRAAIYGVMSLVQWLSLIVARSGSSLIAAAVVLLIAGAFYALAGLKHQQFVGSKTLGGQGVAQMIV
ncbi:Golgi apparatus membrane protein tvp18 [Endocarpon pusillum]|uniref:Golgi apparatus membrane protein tvp18 n=1 Tax=Endocarpon pusillum TaxID=364733 RepID=A0A8H7DY87_9EURO|nr:Golgi apparatus membrane protein tvp18 [Endocarpon pusillum]